MLPASRRRSPGGPTTALLHRISRLVSSSSLDPAEVLRVAAEQITELFAVDHASILLFPSEDLSSGMIGPECQPWARGLRSSSGDEIASLAIAASRALSPML